MKWLCNLVSVLLVLVVSLLSGRPAKAGTGTPISTCGFVITLPGEYNLATDVTCTSTDGIDILASDVTLHLDGHTINGTCDSNTIGVSVSLPVPAPMLKHVRVLGPGTITNFFTGFHAENANDSFVKFTTATTNCPFLSRGFRILGPGGHWKLQGNVSRKQARGAGIALINTDDNRLVANDVNDSIQFLDSSNNVVANNIADDNKTGAGIILVTVKTGSNNNEIHANTTNNNAFAGLAIFVGSTGNNVTGNYSFANSTFDMEDDNPGCGSNKWRGNHFGKANQSCIRSGKDDDSGEDEDRKDDDRG